MALELAVQTPQDVEAMRRLAASGWDRRRIAKELGCSPETVRKYLRQGGWQPYGKPLEEFECLTKSLRRSRTGTLHFLLTHYRWYEKYKQTVV
jgi:hypothetical protein